MISLWFFILTLCIIGFFWYSRMYAETAKKIAQQETKKLQVQLLSVACTQRRMGILKTGNVGMKSQYSFEFTSDGETVYTGDLYLENNQLIQVTVPPHRIN